MNCLFVHLFNKYLDVLGIVYIARGIVVNQTDTGCCLPSGSLKSSNILSIPELITHTHTHTEEDHVRTQKDGSLHANGRGLRRSQPADTLDF